MNNQRPQSFISFTALHSSTLFGQKNCPWNCTKSEQVSIVLFLNLMKANESRIGSLRVNIDFSGLAEFVAIISPLNHNLEKLCTVSIAKTNTYHRHTPACNKSNT